MLVSVDEKTLGFDWSQVGTHTILRVLGLFDNVKKKKGGNPCTHSIEKERGLPGGSDSSSLLLGENPYHQSIYVSFHVTEAWILERCFERIFLFFASVKCFNSGLDLTTAERRKYWNAKSVGRGRCGGGVVGGGE